MNKYRQPCKQCKHYDYCSDASIYPFSHELGVWESMQERRDWMEGRMMGCFKSPEQYKRDAETAAKSIQFNKL